MYWIRKKKPALINHIPIWNTLTVFLQDSVISKWQFLCRRCTNYGIHCWKVVCDWSDGEYRKLSGGTMVRSGYGVHLSSDGTVYMGNWDNDQMNGSGQVQFSSGASYVGEFINNCFQGKGQYTWPNGSHFDGTFVENRFLLLVFIVMWNEDQIQCMQMTHLEDENIHITSVQKWVSSFLTAYQHIKVYFVPSRLIWK